VQPILIIMLATLAGVPLGLWLRHNLAAASYRNADEGNRPDPGPRWWVVGASVLAIGGLATAAVMSHDPLAHLPLIPPAVTGPWLAAVDSDVLRIPNRVLAPTAVATLLAVISITVATQDWMTLIVPTVAALATGGVFATLHFATKGGIGFGDVKLAALIGLSVGSVGIGAVWLSLLVGSLAAVVWTKATRAGGPIPIGPWLLCGAWVSVFAGVIGSG
jgi:leader peptidase (prepilin peptidase)/N-methyltransferase